MYRVIPPLVVLGPRFKCDCLRASLLTVLLYMPSFGLVQERPWFRFDPPCGSHQLPVFLKYSVRLKLLAQHVHLGECKAFCGLAQTSQGHPTSHPYARRWDIEASGTPST